MPGDRERTEAQGWASSAYYESKLAVQFDAEREDCIHDTSRCYLAMMRNAWVAYHAGAPWMHGPFAGAGYLMARNLGAEVDEVRAHAEHDRETLTPLENAFEATGPDLVEAVTGLRAEVERLRRNCSEHVWAESNPDGYESELSKARAEVERLTAQRDRLQESASMACENPCGDCAGCQTGHELLGGETPSDG